MPYLAQLDAIIDPRGKMGAFLGLIQSDWLGLFSELRAQRPVLPLPLFDVVSRWADVIDVLSRPDSFGVTYGPHMDPSVGPFMLGHDGTEPNWRDKSLMRTLLRWEDLPSIRSLAGEVAQSALLAAASEGTGTVDVVATVSRLVPLRIVQRSFGFPGPDDAAMLRWSHATQADMFHNLTNDPSILQTNIAAGQEMQAWLRPWLESRQPWQDATGEDTVSRLLRATAAGVVNFDTQAVVSNICGLLVGAIETTSQAIVNATEQILLRSDQMTAALGALATGDTGKFDSIVWEALRFKPMTTFVIRVATADTVLAPGSDHETPIKAGRLVAAGIGSAMFDPGVFTDPNGFHARPREQYLHMGYGSHICLGQFVAYAMVPATVGEILSLPGVHLLPDGGSAVDNRGGPFAESFRLGIAT